MELGSTIGVVPNAKLRQNSLFGLKDNEESSFQLEDYLIVLLGTRKKLKQFWNRA